MAAYPRRFAVPPRAHSQPLRFKQAGTLLLAAMLAGLAVFEYRLWSMVPGEQSGKGLSAAAAHVLSDAVVLAAYAPGELRSVARQLETSMGAPANSKSVLRWRSTKPANPWTLNLHAAIVSGHLAKEAYAQAMVRDGSMEELHGMTLQKLGRVFTHIDAWKLATESRKWTLIMERGVELLPNIDSILSQVTVQAPRHAAIVHLDMLAESEGEAPAVSSGRQQFRSVVRRLPPNAPRRMLAYLLSADGARTLLQHVYPINSTIGITVARIALAQELSIFECTQPVISPPATFDATQPEEWDMFAAGGKLVSVQPILIPKIFHFIWLGGAPMPPAHAANVRRWQRMYPDWKVIVWTEAMLPKLLNQKRYDAATSFTQKSDIVRYEIVREQGGIYMDVDFEPLKNFEPLLHGLEAFVAWESDKFICNGIFGATPHHPLVETLATGLEANWKKFEKGTINQQTGPHYMTKVARELELTLEDGFHAFSTRIFFPYSWSEVDPGAPYNPLSYTVHHFKDAVKAKPVATTTAKPGADLYETPAVRPLQAMDTP